MIKICVTLHKVVSDFDNKKQTVDIKMLCSFATAVVNIASYDRTPVQYTHAVFFRKARTRDEISSVQFKMVFIRSGRPIWAPPGLSGVSPNVAIKTVSMLYLIDDGPVSSSQGKSLSRFLFLRLSPPETSASSVQSWQTLARCWRRGPSHRQQKELSHARRFRLISVPAVLWRAAHRIHPHVSCEVPL